MAGTKALINRETLERVLDIISQSNGVTIVEIMEGTNSPTKHLVVSVCRVTVERAIKILEDNGCISEGVAMYIGKGGKISYKKAYYFESDLTEDNYEKNISRDRVLQS